MSRTFVAAQAPDRLVYRKGNEYFVWTPIAEDTPLPMDPPDHEMFLAALFSKWGFLPVVGDDGKTPPEMDDENAPIVEPAKAEDGSDVWKVTEIVNMETGKSVED